MAEDAGLHDEDMIQCNAAAQAAHGEAESKSMSESISAEQGMDLHSGGKAVASDDDLSPVTDDDDLSFLELSLSPIATRMTSTRMPLASSAPAMEAMETGDDLEETDEDMTPPAVPEVSFKQWQSQSLGPLGGTPLANTPSSSPTGTDTKEEVTTRSEVSRSAFKSALGGPVKSRSSSGSGDALRKYLPSMPNIGDFLPHFGSSARSYSLKSPPTSSSPSNAKASGLHGRADEAGRAPMLRRSTSHDSMLYHSLSRSSSLGDDSRWAHHHEMVNSRVKAIRDSLQDRSSFRLPSLPSMPHSPAFAKAMNLASNLSPTNVSFKWFETDRNKGNLPNTSKKKASIAAVPIGVTAAAVVTPGIITSAAVDSSQETVFERTIASLTGDIVIMGGYRGSILRSSHPPHRQVWVPVKVGLNIRKVNLEVGLDREDEERMEESVYASGMLQHIGPVDISRRLIRRLRETENCKNGLLRIHDYGYDWRLSPDILARKLTAFLESLACNLPASTQKGALVIAHSLGGLITRHVVNRRPQLFSGVVYAGVPQACVNILGPIRNGDAVLLSSRVLTAQVNFTLRTSFALLPLEGYCFEDKQSGKPILVDYFNVDDWIRYRFSPCTDPPLPPMHPPSSSIASMLKSSSFTNLQLPSRKSSVSGPLRQSRPATESTGSTLPDGTPAIRGTIGDSAKETGVSHDSSVVDRAANIIEDIATTDRSIGLGDMGSRSNPAKHGQSIQTSVSTTVTIPRAKAIAYLTRVLGEVKQFKQELAHDPRLTRANVYPPLAVIYGKSVPTVATARVNGRDSIACADAYDDLGFASGDGVCLAREAMLPSGYHCVRGGRISSDRGHVTLLGDLNAVGAAIEAVVKGRDRGIGLGEAALSAAQLDLHRKEHENGDEHDRAGTSEHEIQ